MAKKREHLKDIKLSESGGYEYTGEVLRIAPPEGRSAKDVYATIGASALLLALAVISSGLIDADVAIRSYYIILPYVGEVISMFIMLWYTVRILYARDRVRRYILDSSTGKIQGGAMVLAIFAVIGLIFSGIYLARNGMGDSQIKSSEYMILRVLTAALAYRYSKYFGSLKWEPR